MLFMEIAWETEGRSTVEKLEKSIKGTFATLAADVYKPVSMLFLSRDLTNSKSKFVIDDIQKTYTRTDTAKVRIFFVSNTSSRFSYWQKCLAIKAAIMVVIISPKITPFTLNPSNKIAKTIKILITECAITAKACLPKSFAPFNEPR
jgi:hypothetical protein